MILFIYFPWKTYNLPLVLSFFVISVLHIPTEHNLCFVNSLEIPSLTLDYKLLTFQIQNPTFIFHYLCRSKRIKFREFLKIL